MDDRLATSLKSHWAFTPPARHAAPDLPASLDPSLRDAWSVSPIDRFIGSELG
jgi:hypothetical protein